VLRFRESRTDVLKQEDAAEQHARGSFTTTTRSVSSPVAPRMDTLPPSFQQQRERVIEEAALRSTSLGSPGGRGVYPPNSKLHCCQDVEKFKLTNHVSA
jgi:hypothetical protein